MNRFVAGAVACLLLVTGGLFWWQIRAEGTQAQRTPPVALTPAPLPEEGLPVGDEDAIGEAPPMPPEASEKSREAKRFDRYDRNRDGIITRTEMLASRAKAFSKLDTDGNNLLSFEEWAVATSDKFAGADADGDGKLSRAEFATTAPKSAAKPKCKC
ncbi:MAG: EF-hand domain-containing protein [Sphingobium sp.]